ncbi:MAG: hypothetical protein HYZ50_05955 [Deltaproteobacteria bacterium]|nr:hypothetical protein [Deltaproteobacteria bacterium]
MHSWSALPAAALKNVGAMSADFLARGIGDCRAAGCYLHRLPYGRNTDRANFRLVLPEGRGTCSTKHALLAELAREQELPLLLTLGIYEMHERNTPGVGYILGRYGLPFIPEAHCYLTYRGRRIDVTRSGVEPTEPIDRFLYEETIVPEHIGDYKVHMHQRFLREWVVSTDFAGNRSFDEVWAIREACIAALSQKA